MKYDIVFVTGEIYFDHPLCGVAILKRLLEKEGYTVGVIEQPKSEEDVRKLGKPRLFFGVTSGGIDSMVRNYTPLKKKREEDMHLDYREWVPDRAVNVYSKWIRTSFPYAIIALGGTEASLRRFTQYDYWSNKLRNPILLDSGATILVYGSGEKQILEIAERTKEKKRLDGILGTCIVRKKVPEGFEELPTYHEVVRSKERFCDMQNMLSNRKNLAQRMRDKYVLQYRSPEYTTEDLDSYYELPFTRNIPEGAEHLRSFEFSVVTHRGCIGNCSFCSLNLLQGDRIISRSEESILREIEGMAKLEGFRGNVDDVGGPSANMYGMDCNKCGGDCIDCPNLDRSNSRLIGLLRKARKVSGIDRVRVRSGIRFDLASGKYLKEIVKWHTYDTLRVAPEHVNKEVLRLMNKDRGDLKKFINEFHKTKTKKKLSFYFMTAHPGSTMREAEELADALKNLENSEFVQVFTPTPMTVSTCMYWTGMDPKTKKPVYVPHSFSEKKQQKRVIFERMGKKAKDSWD